MSAEHNHQLYGGDISDYMLPQKMVNRQYEDPSLTDKNISDIYSSQIQGKRPIDTTGIYRTGLTRPEIQRDAQINKMEQLLNQTLTTIAQQLNLNDSDTSKNTPSLRDQTNDDINAANQRVLQAMTELNELLKTISD